MFASDTLSSALQTPRDNLLMAIGDLEYPLKRGPQRALQCWSSAWLDLLHAGQMLHLFLAVPENERLAKVFERRALVDAAVVAYGRLFNDGTRKGVVDLTSWLDELGPEVQALHDEALRWRHGHMAHRGKNDLEHLTVTVLWEKFGSTQPALRLRMESSSGPDDDFARDLLAVCELLRNWIWERKFWPLQQAALAALGPRALDGMRSRAQPYKDRSNVERALRVTQDIGSEMPTPTRPPRKLPSGKRR